MVKVLIGDIFASKAHALVNTVNCVGVMGKGIALDFKKRFPKQSATCLCYAGSGPNSAQGCWRKSRSDYLSRMTLI